MRLDRIPSGDCGFLVGMYLRRTQRRRKDGSAVGYLQLAHNRRVGGVTRAEVLLNLGREDELDVEGLRRLARSITRYTDGEGGDVAAVAGEELEVVESRPFGGAYGARRAVAAAGRRRGDRAGARRAALRHRCRAGAVRPGRQPGAEAVLQAGGGRLGRRATCTSPA